METSKEYRVYAVNVNNTGDEECPNMSDERFMELAEAAGTVYSLKGFQHAFNYDEAPSPYDSYIRILEV